MRPRSRSLSPTSVPYRRHATNLSRSFFLRHAPPARRLLPPAGQRRKAGAVVPPGSATSRGRSTLRCAAASASVYPAPRLDRCVIGGLPARHPAALDGAPAPPRQAAATITCVCSDAPLLKSRQSDLARQNARLVVGSRPAANTWLYAPRGLKPRSRATRLPFRRRRRHIVGLCRSMGAACPKAARASCC